MIVLLVVSAILFSSAYVDSASLWSQTSREAADDVDSLLVTLNEYITEQSLNQVPLPMAVVDGWLVKKTFSSGVIRDLGTITRVGNASIVPAEQGGVVSWAVQAELGLRSLSLETDFLLETLFGLLQYRGHLTVDARSNQLDVEATVVANNSSCTLVMNDLAVVKLRDFKVSIENAGLLRPILERLIKYVIHYVVPTMTEGVNNELHEFIRTYPINADITSYVCRYFRPV